MFQDERRQMGRFLAMSPNAKKVLRQVRPTRFQEKVELCDRAGAGDADRLWEWSQPRAVEGLCGWFAHCPGEAAHDCHTCRLPPLMHMHMRMLIPHDQPNHAQLRDLEEEQVAGPEGLECDAELVKLWRAMGGKRRRHVKPKPAPAHPRSARSTNVTGGYRSFGRNSTLHSILATGGAHRSRSISPIPGPDGMSRHTHVTMAGNGASPGRGSIRRHTLTSGEDIGAIAAAAAAAGAMYGKLPPALVSSPPRNNGGRRPTYDGDMAASSSGPKVRQLSLVSINNASARRSSIGGKKCGRFLMEVVVIRSWAACGGRGC